MSTPKYLGFSERLKSLMSDKESKIKTVRQLQNCLGVTYEMARRYTIGTAKPREEKMLLLAKELNVGIGYLNHGIESNIAPIDIDDFKGKPIPVISWVQAGSWTNAESITNTENVDDWLPPNKDCGLNGYGLKVAGISMMPDFKPNDRIYINPDYPAFDLKTNDLVIVSCFGEAEVTFKKLIIEGANKYLQPLNPNWPEQIIPLTEDCKLVGKVVGLYRQI